MKAKTILILLITTVFNVSADEIIPIGTGEGGNGGGGNGGGTGGGTDKPKAPARRIVNCDLEDGELIISSQSSAIGEVLIYDNFSGDVVLHTFTSFAPQYTIDLSALAGSYTLIININGYSYQYEISL